MYTVDIVTFDFLVAMVTICDVVGNGMSVDKLSGITGV